MSSPQQHRRATTFTSIAATALLMAVTVLSGCAPAGPTLIEPGQSSARTSIPRIEQSIVPLPPGITGVGTQSCAWTSDSAAIMCPFVTTEAGFQLGVIRPDGSSYHCITCQQPLTGEPGFLAPLADGHRVFFATTPSDRDTEAGADFTPFIAECPDSWDVCDAPILADVRLPKIPDALNIREPRITPDGSHLVWTVLRRDGYVMLIGTLQRTSEGYEVVDARVLNPVPTPRTAEDWAARNALSEAKSFFNGTTLVYASTRDQGGNLDVYTLDLTNGSSRRVTSNPEWDEDAQLDPTGHFMILGSARNMHNQMRALAAADIPPFLDATVLSTLSRAALGTALQRRHVLEKWLVTPGDEAAGRDGVMINSKSGGWASGASKNPWSPDGTRAVWGERGPDGATRLVTTVFVGLPAQQPCGSSCAIPDLSWAPPAESYPALPAGTYRIAGPRGGQASYVTSGNIFGPRNEIDYRDYVQPDGTILNGAIKAIGLPIAGQSQTISTHIALSGSSSGTFRVEIHADDQRVCGTATTLRDGASVTTQLGQWNPLCGHITPQMCPDGADADGTATGDCSQDQDPRRFLAEGVLP